MCVGLKHGTKFLGIRPAMMIRDAGVASGQGLPVEARHDDGLSVAPSTDALFQTVRKLRVDVTRYYSNDQDNLKVGSADRPITRGRLIV